LQASAVKLWAEDHQIPVYQPLNFKNNDAIAQLAALNPDVLVVIAYGLILPPAVLAIPRLGCINVHASLLPRWRGASPIQQVILAGDDRSGVSLMQMDVGLDTGAVFKEIDYPLSERETAGSLHDHLAGIAARPLVDLLNDLASGSAIAKPQDNDKATYAGKIKKEDAHIDWQRSALEIDRLIRAFNPWPIAYTTCENELLRIHQASVRSLSVQAKPGTILQLDREGILVATSQNGLLIEKIQFPGGKAMLVADWLNAGKTKLRTGLLLQ
jgi:methionyl-tRNA formyltransferase